jgi:hypothetical protein
VPPVATAIGKHDGEVTDKANARSRKDWARVGVSPSVATVAGLEDKVRVVVGEATTAFVHPGDVHVACNEVTGDLHVTDEASLSAHHDRTVPSETVVSREGDEDVRVGLIKVVP